MTKKSRKDGPELPITAEWLALVVEALAFREWDRQTLAREVSVSKATISHVLNQTSEKSRLVRPISEKLGIPLYVAMLYSEEDLTWLKVGQRLRRIDPLFFNRELERLLDKIDLAESSKPLPVVSLVPSPPEDD